MKDNNYTDVMSDYNGIFLRYYHYERNGAHIYMLSNEDISNEITATLKLSAFSGGKYIEYDAFENVAYTRKSDGKVFVNIPPYNSRLIIFGDICMDEIPELVPFEKVSEKKLELSYKVSVAERNEEEFKAYKETKELFNITGRNELPHFSGHIKYETVFEGKPGKCIIDLGYVGEVAELYVNGEFVGEKLFPPYRFNASKFVKDGENKMEIIVTNHNGYAVRDKFSKFLLFEPSGLLGDVKLIYVK